ncbi:MAG: choice-of-anchor D domain-containing protein, partial [Candidatus Cloacimonetes bacterium]|nr:choice-of-anchor D domain-containing protein [Candidatus Cloacimonadota bacterium]
DQLMAASDSYSYYNIGGFPSIFFFYDEYSDDPTYHTVNDLLIYQNLPYYQQYVKLITYFSMIVTGITPEEETVPIHAINPTPENNATFIELSQVLSWSPNTTGITPTGYKLYFGTTNPPTVLVAELASDQTSWTPVLDYNTTYYWQVVPFNTTGDAVNNPVWSFTTIPPVPLHVINPTPEDNATFVELTQVLSWSPDTTGSTPTGYKLYFGTSNPPQTVVAELASDQTSWTPVLDYNTTYYWQVVPFNTTGDAVNNPIWSFTTIPPVPNHAINPTPENNATFIELSQILSWSPNTTGSTPTGYKLYFGTLNPPTAVVAELASDQTTWTPVLDYNTTYYWQVVPFNTTGDAVNNPVWSFTTIPPVPNHAINPTPEDNATFIELSQILSWSSDTSGSTPTGYKIYFGTSNPPPLVTDIISISSTKPSSLPDINSRRTSNSSNRISLSSIESNFWTPTTELQYDTTYYWQIVPFNTTGDAIDNPIWSFTTIPYPPIFTINHLSYDFGDVIIGSSSDAHAFTISNTGGSPLTISAIIITGANAGEFNLNHPALPLVINAGNNAVVSASFAPITDGDKSASISFTHDANDSPHNVTLSGIGLGLPVFIIDPLEHNFGNVVVGETTDPYTYTITNTGGSPLVVNTIDLIGTNHSEFSLSISGLPWTIVVNETRTFTVSFAPSAPIGIKTAYLNITHNASDSPHTDTTLIGDSVVSESDVVVFATNLHVNYPNPFNPETTIKFTLSNSGHVRMDIFNIRGSLVRTLVDNEMNRGEHTVIWNGKDNNGQEVSSGIYFYQMKTSDFSSIKRMVLMK